VDDAISFQGANRSYRHEALLWRAPEEFLKATVPFVSEALGAGESVMVAVAEQRAHWLREALGSDAEAVLFVDMAQLGRNPARLTPAWRRFVEHAGTSQPVRGIQEPVWLGRRPEEIVEGQLHEALLNVAVEPDTPFWLMCPYEASRLDSDVVEEVYRSHPAVVADTYRGSHLYGGRDHVDRLWSADLPPLQGEPELVPLSRAALKGVPALVAATAYAAGVTCDKSAELAVVVHQLVKASVHRGATEAVLRIWTSHESVICQLSDEVVRRDPLVDRKPPLKDQRNSLYTAHELCDLVQVRSSLSGTTVRVHTWL
jgi:hypothetical protein